MPTSLPRINVTLSPEAAAALRQLATLTRQSQSRIVGDLVEDSVPLMLQTSRMLQQAEKLTKEARLALRLDLAKHEADAQAATVSALATIAATERAIQTAADGEARSARRPGRTESRTPPPPRRPPVSKGGA